jgi:hypothetical protein
MDLKKITTAVILLATMTTVFAQAPVLAVRVVDVENVATLVMAPTSSSASSCNSPDFPVIRSGSKEEIDFNNISWLTVRHDIPASSEIYVTVELTSRSGSVETVEMIGGIRISGKTEEGEFRVKVKDISTLQVLHKPG